MTRHPLDDLQDDIRDHIERATEENIASGMTPEAARHAARQRFGSTALAAERTRGVWIPVWLDQCRQDLRYALRTLFRNPGVSGAIVLMLALGIGVTSAVFSVVHGVMLRPLPYRDPDRIVSIWEMNVSRNRPRNVIASVNYLEWKTRSRSFDGMGMLGPYSLSMTLDGRAEEVRGFLATSDIFRVLGVTAARGRFYNADEDFGPNTSVMVLDYDFWQSRFGGRADIIGQSVQTATRVRTVIGILPRGFTMEGVRGNFYIPYGQSPEALRAAAGRGFSHALAHLRDGVSLEQATAEMTTIAAARAVEDPQRNTNWTVTLIPVHEQTTGNIRKPLLVLSGAVLLVLLLACANIASLLLARSTARARELGLRTALGAGRGRLVRQMLTESLLFAGIGGGAGLLLAVVFQRALVSLVAEHVDIPRLDQVALDGSVILFTAGVSIATGLVFGVLPALVATRGRGDAFRDMAGSRITPESRRMLASLTVMELALSVVLLAGAGLLGLSFSRLQRIDPGFRVDGVLTARISLSGPRWNDPARSAGFYTDVIDRLTRSPGIKGAAGISFLPLNGLAIGTSYWPLDAPPPAAGTARSTDVLPTTPGFFQTMGIPMVQGRDFNARDTLDSPVVAIVSEMFARSTFNGESPIGKRIHISIGLPRNGDAEIVGVVRDTARSSLDGEVRPAAYVPHTQLAIGVMTLVVRGAGDALAIAPAVSAIIRETDGGVPIADVRSMQSVVDDTLGQSRAVAVLLAAFAAAALALSAAGVYGVMSYWVSRRTQEIGVRVALGARPASIVGMVVGQAARLAALGVAAGLVVALLLARLIATMLYGTTPDNPVVFTAVVLLLLATALVAAWIPARRASRIDPLAALRCD